MQFVARANPFMCHLIETSSLFLSRLFTKQKNKHVKDNQDKLTTCFLLPLSFQERFKANEFCVTCLQVSRWYFTVEKWLTHSSQDPSCSTFASFILIWETLNRFISGKRHKDPVSHSTLHSTHSFQLPRCHHHHANSSNEGTSANLIGLRTSRKCKRRANTLDVCLMFIYDRL